MSTASVSGRRIRILHVVQSLETGGLENGVVNLANSIDQDRFPMDLLCLRALGPLRARLAPQVRVFHADQPRAGIGAAIRLIYTVCRRHGYDIVHTHGWATLLPGYCAGRLARVPLIVNGEHGTLYFDTLGRRLAQRLLFRLVDFNCTVSRDLGAELVRRFRAPAERIRPIINGVDTDRFCPDDALRSQARAQLGIASDEIVIGTVGRLVGVKDYRTLIRAFVSLTEARERTRLILVGDGEQAAELRAACPAFVETGRVLFLGNRDDVPALMNAMDVFALTSLREGLSNTLLEAQACGKPVVATQTGGNGEIIEDGVTGRLFPVGDWSALATLMGELCGDPVERSRLGRNARTRVIGERSILRMAQDYETFYSDLARYGGAGLAGGATACAIDGKDATA